MVTGFLGIGTGHFAEVPGHFAKETHHHGKVPGLLWEFPGHFTKVTRHLWKVTVHFFGLQSGFSRVLAENGGFHRKMGGFEAFFISPNPHRRPV